jgi:hypothetical protein
MLYFTHDNGDRPLAVQIITPPAAAAAAASEILGPQAPDGWLVAKYTDVTADIHTTRPPDTDDGAWSVGPLIKTYEHVDVWAPRGIFDLSERERLGDEMDKPYGDGNCLLLHLRQPALRRHRYALVYGDRIMEFSFPEPILEMQSQIYPSDVPYPMARTDNHVLALYCQEYARKKVAAGRNLFNEWLVGMPVDAATPPSIPRMRTVMQTFR